MRKALTALAAIVAIVAVVLLASGGGGEDDGYVVRGYFDSSSFMVEGEEVRVAGATVGEIQAVDVSMPGEIANYSKTGKPEAIPGKAVVVMKITDPGFQDFRRDASCHIRPQSLIGEKFVDCRPTIPRAPGSEPPPALKKVPDGQPGEGQYLLPLENNSTSVDPDLINNIQRLPYSQRFRIILNELGAGLAGRGEDIEEAVKRANPVLRDADRLFVILSDQRDRISQLAADSEQILRPLTAEREHVSGFLSNAGAAAEATTERGEDLEASLRKLPEFMREFRATLRSLQGFSESAEPVFSELGRAAPSFTSWTRALAPFSAASTVSLKSLGATGEAAGPKFRAADPIVKKASALAQSGVVPTSELAKFLVSIKQTKGFDRLMDTIYNGSGAVNEFDRYGHFARTLVAIVDCAEYQVTEFRGQCNANFTGEAGASSTFDWLYRALAEDEAASSGGTLAGPSAPPVSEAAPSEEPSIGESEDLEGAEEAEGESDAPEEEEGEGETSEATAQRALLDYFLRR